MPTIVSIRSGFALQDPNDAPDDILGAENDTPEDDRRKDVQMTTRSTKTAAIAAVALMASALAGCGSSASWDADRMDAVWSDHVADAGTPLTADEFETTTWRASNGDMVMFHDTSEAWPHMPMPTTRGKDDHHTTLIPENVQGQSELLQFEFLQYADVKLDGAYYVVSTSFPADPADLSGQWNEGKDGDLFVLAVNTDAHEGYRVRATASGLDAQCMTNGVKDAGCYQVLFQGLADDAKANGGVLTLEYVDMGTGDADASTSQE